MYYDGYERNLLPYTMDEKRGTVDIDFSHHFAAGSRNDIVWGAGLFSTSDQLGPGKTVSFTPSQRRDNRASAFIQDQIKLTGTLSLALGSKFEYNSYTGYETAPSAQLIWTVRPEHTIWLSASKAIREPARYDTALHYGASTVPLGGGATGVLTIFGTPNVKAEEVRAYEAGYRTQVSKHLSLDVTAFVNFYRRLSTQEAGSPYFVSAPNPQVVIPMYLQANAHARNTGGEVSATWMAASRWKMVAGYTQLHIVATHDPSSHAGVPQVAGYSPAHQFQIRSLVNLSSRWEWDTSLAYTGRLTTQGIPGMARLDTRLGWHAGESLEFSLVGQNLLSPGRLEFVSQEGTVSTQIQRSVFGKVTWRF